MTWGSNASYDEIQCPYCAGPMVDDSDDWPTSHMKACEKRPKGFWRWLRDTVTVEAVQEK